MSTRQHDVPTAPSEERSDQIQTASIIEDEVEARFGLPTREQVQTLKQLNAHYYALLGPQSLLEAGSNVSRTLYTVVTPKKGRQTSHGSD